MQLNHALFQTNGGCGYVLKPKHIRSSKYDSFQISPLFLSIKVISAQQLPKFKGKGKVVDPFVEVEVAGYDEDCAKFKTRTVSNNGKFSF
jgi:hypothetical protein